MLPCNPGSTLNLFTWVQGSNPTGTLANHSAVLKGDKRWSSLWGIACKSSQSVWVLGKHICYYYLLIFCINCQLRAFIDLRVIHLRLSTEVYWPLCLQKQMVLE